MTTQEKLEALVSNLWWTWRPDALALFESLNPEVFRASANNPVAALRAADPKKLKSKTLAADVDALYEAFTTYMETPGTHADTPPTAYFCMEYGLHESLPLYSGGLGILAGDHTKAASDLSVPFTAVGLLLRDGYFKQTFDQSGWQTEQYPVLDPHDHPMTLVTTRGGDPLRVTVHLGDMPLKLQAWRVHIGRTVLYLLDSDHDGNVEWLRPLTRKLYQGDRRVRLQQEIILGIGGLRLLRALNVSAHVYHLNEGHCAFVTFELMRERMAAGHTREEAEAWVRDHTVFTTHTPVLAGHDRFEPHLLLEELQRMRHALGLSEHDLMAYGRVNAEDHQEWFTMTVLALGLSRLANGVSKLNGEVAREQWKSLYPDRPVEDVPIGSVTNGIHLPTWTAPEAKAFAKQHLGPWNLNRATVAYWKGIETAPDADLWALRNRLRQKLVRYAEQHVARQTLRQGFNLHPDALTIGFARRFATYKRATLLFHDVERALRILTSDERPVQVLFAGKAHPADEGGKRFIQQIYAMSQLPEMKGRLLFLENYNMEVARMLVSGCDVWLNNPRRPMEASGTSGQKVSAHGGLNLSILDGWWPEGYDGTTGWAIGTDASAEMGQDPQAQDEQDAAFLYETLETSVIPAFYERDKNGLPTGWLKRMRSAMSVLPAQFSAERMVADYAEQMYAATVELSA